MLEITFKIHQKGQQQITSTINGKQRLKKEGVQSCSLWSSMVLSCPSGFVG